MPLVRLTLVLAAVGLAALATLVALIARATVDDRSSSILGFSKQSVASQLNVERRIGLASTERIRADHRYLTEKPHVAGSPRDRELAEWTAAQWRTAGLDEVEIIEH